MAYRVKAAFANKPMLRAMVNGKLVGLNGSFAKESAGNAKQSPKTVTVPKATDAELKALFEQGNPCVEQYEEEKPAKPTIPPTT